MTDKKTYRTHWTIEEIDAPYAEVQWYKHQIDMDNVHYCYTVEEAEREIDDAIIMEQEQVIQRLHDALLDSNRMLEHAQTIIHNYATRSELIDERIAENQNLINAFKS